MTKQSKAVRWAAHLESFFVSEDVPAVDARKIAAELRRLDAVETAARNLVQVKGRYHTEQAYKALQDALGEKKAFEDARKLMTSYAVAVASAGGDKP